jgi:hypothetical protein
MGEKVVESNLVNETPSPEVVTIEIEGGNPDSIPEPKAKRKYNKRKTSEEKTATKSEMKEAESDISDLLVMGFGVVSLRAGDHWAIDKKEADSIAKPLSKILEKYNLMNKAQEASAPIALIMATASIVIPRIIITSMNSGDKKKEKVLKNNGVMKDEESRSNISDGGGIDSTSHERPEPGVANYVKTLYTEI